MTSIIIYTNEECLEHKRGLKKGEEHFESFYWEFSRFPKRVEEGDKIYFATKGFIRGYFIIDDINCDDRDICHDPMAMPDNCLNWRANSWVELKNPIPTKSFQGFKYADKVEGLE